METVNWLAVWFWANLFLIVGTVVAWELVAKHVVMPVFWKVWDAVKSVF